MKEHINVIKDSFIDYSGKEHHFVIAAITTPFEDEGTGYPVVYGDGTANVLVKKITLGVSICNPEDTFNEKTGVMRALGRAKQSDPVLYAVDGDVITNFLVDSLLAQEAKFLKNNPGLFIRGYNEAKERYLKNNKMNELANNFSETERIIIDNIKKNPNYLDNVNEYIKWFNSQQCKNHGK